MLTMRQKKAVTKELKDRYQRASKKEKTIILNEFIRLAGYFFLPIHSLFLSGMSTLFFLSFYDLFPLYS